MSRITDWLRHLDRVEPARLRAFWVALVALLAALGVTVGADLDGKVTAAIGLLAVLLPIVQGETTRAKVYSPATVDTIRNENEDVY